MALACRGPVKPGRPRRRSMLLVLVAGLLVALELAPASFGGGAFTSAQSPVQRRRLASRLVRRAADSADSDWPSLRAIGGSVYAAVFGDPARAAAAAADDDDGEAVAEEVSESSYWSHFKAVSSSAYAAVFGSGAAHTAEHPTVEVTALATVPEPSTLLDAIQEALGVSIIEPSEGAGALVAAAVAAAAEGAEQTVAEVQKWAAVPWSNFEEVTAGTKDFFLFIKEYPWSLRYKVAMTDDDSVDVSKPLDMEWVKLKRPVRSAADLFEGGADDLLDWAVREPPRHEGFMYRVEQAVGSGAEAVINFFRDKGPNLLVLPDGVHISGAPQSEEMKKATQSGEGTQGDKHVTHCFVEVGGLFFMPILQSIAFFNLQEVVMDWQA
mmetsp:Transcript_54230/g.153625  ORF Transcript_54230/g.153625 Transcript_54230/m.153625 type:complete len:381 (+) Transcript_54230:70-1212(+)